jgi:hypothetical protein
MYQNRPGGRNLEKNQENYLATGIGIQKMVHPESAAGWGFMQMRFPFPFIRLADLYLMRAEAYNALDMRAEAWADVNAIRSKYGLPNVEEVWSDPKRVMTEALNKHTKQKTMLDIILQERSIELAFEGIHYWDMVRYNKATTVFSQPIQGWNINGRNKRDFFLVRSIQYRRFPRSSYLWPISVAEINTNSNLINNPGW